MTTVLIVDDVRPMAEQYAYDLKRLAGFETIVSFDGDDALATLAREPIDCVVLDLEMPGKDGFAVLRAMRERGLVTPVVVYTGTGNYDRCIQAIRLGAYSFVDKADPVERVAREVENAVERRLLITEVTELRRYSASDTALRGVSPAMKKLKDSIARVAPIPSTVLIVGESGSGKELVARDVHRLSGGGREREPFVAVNCGALAEGLIESELFGHERGAFTGANVTRKGAFEAAGKGTIFLDEVGELPAAAQAKLLRVLEERVVRRLGGAKSVPIDFRLISSTNRSAEAALKDGHLRRDLYFRINTVTISVPPLRDRRDDIPILVEAFLEHYRAKHARPVEEIEPEAYRRLLQYPWPGNVRELQHAIERAVLVARTRQLTVGDLPESLQHGPTDGETGSIAPSEVPAGSLEDIERASILKALDATRWNKQAAAALLGLRRPTLYSKMRKHNIPQRRG
jgi:two-component system response regulator HydG